MAKTRSAKSKVKLSAQSTVTGVQKRDANRRKVDAGKSTKIFKNPVKIGDQDILSHLPSDCLGHIFTLLNQYDLDRMSRVSQTLHAVAAYSRPRSVKTQAMSITISQKECKLFLADEESGYLVRRYEMKLREQKFKYEGLFIPQHYEYIQDSILPISRYGKVAPVDCQLMNNLRPLLSRFSIGCYDFDQIRIDNRFLENFANFGGKSLKRLSFIRCSFDRKLGSEGRDRFLSLLMKAKPSKLTLGFSTRKDEANIFDKEFIQRYASIVTNPKLSILDKSDMTLVDRELSAILIRFDFLQAKSLVVSPEMLLDMILKRLDMEEVEAQWDLSASGNCFDDEILATIDRTKYSHPFDNVIGKTDSDFGARYTMYFQGTYLRVTVQFTKR